MEKQLCLTVNHENLGLSRESNSYKNKVLSGSLLCHTMILTGQSVSSCDETS